MALCDKGKKRVWKIKDFYDLALQFLEFKLMKCLEMRIDKKRKRK